MKIECHLKYGFGVLEENAVKEIALITISKAKMKSEKRDSKMH